MTGPNTCGNPCPVVDEQTGTIWLLLTHNPGRYGRSQDQGAQARRHAHRLGLPQRGRRQDVVRARRISRPRPKNPSWGWYATGPGVGIQIQHGPHRGRLVIPCDHSFQGRSRRRRQTGRRKRLACHLQRRPRPDLEAGRHGAPADERVARWWNWPTARAACCSTCGRPRRPTAARQSAQPRRRAELDGPGVCARTGRAALPGKPPALQLAAAARSRAAFSSPTRPAPRRTNLTVRVSRDDGKTWPVAKTLHEGPAAYSCLTVLPDKSIGCLYECGRTNPYEKITFARFPLAWIEQEN